MPIYEYQCRECNHRLEKIQKMSDAPLTLCPECGRETLTKLVSAAGFRLKGGGWYETDFKKDGKRNLAGDDSSAKAGGGSDSGAGEGGKGSDAKESSKSSGASSDSSTKSDSKTKSDSSSKSDSKTKSGTSSGSSATSSAA